MRKEDTRGEEESLEAEIGDEVHGLSDCLL